MLTLEENPAPRAFFITSFSESSVMDSRADLADVLSASGRREAAWRRFRNRQGSGRSSQRLMDPLAATRAKT